MALSFLSVLSDLGNVAKKATPVVNNIGNIVDAIRGPRDFNNIASISQMPTDAEGWAGSLYDSLVNPNSPQLDALANREYQLRSEALLSQIRAMAGSDRRLMARGQRGSFFSPETADQNVDFLISRGLPQLMADSRNAATDRIYGAANGIRGFIPVQAARQGLNVASNQTMAAQEQLNGGSFSRFGQVTDAISNLLRGLQGRQPSSLMNGRT